MKNCFSLKVTKSKDEGGDEDEDVYGGGDEVGSEVNIKLFWLVCFLTHRLTDERMYIGNCRVAFVTEK